MRWSWGRRRTRQLGYVVILNNVGHERRWGATGFPHYSGSRVVYFPEAVRYTQRNGDLVRIYSAEGATLACYEPGMAYTVIAVEPKMLRWIRSAQRAWRRNPPKEC